MPNPLLPPTPSPWRRRLLVGIALLPLTPLLALGVGMARMWPDPTQRTLERRGEVAEVQREAQVRDLHLREDLRVRSTSGLEVEVAVLRPDVPGPLPLMVLLVGHRTGKEAVELFGQLEDTVLASISYPYDGPMRFSLLEAITAVPRVQTALLDTPAAVLLALDALMAEAYVDPERVELVCVSLGVLLGPQAAALDPRFRRVWLVHGAGDAPRLIAHQMRKRVGSERLRLLFGRTLAALAGAQHLAPELWAPRISPRELILVNALDDQSMPPECVRALHDSVLPSTEIIWVPGGHVRAGKAEIVSSLFRLVHQRMQRDGEALRAEHIER